MNLGWGLLEAREPGGLDLGWGSTVGAGKNGHEGHGSRSTFAELKAAGPRPEFDIQQAHIRGQLGSCATPESIEWLLLLRFDLLVRA